MTIPGKVQTYLAAGVPLLAMLDGEGARVIEEARAGLVAPAGDSAVLAERVLELCAMTDDQRRAMGANGRAYCQREFDRAHLVTQLETWLSEVAA
jgi:glycosyltransferase involved in cell wall biosynthesis